MASLPSRGANEKETLADEIRTIVRRRALSPGAAARLVDLPATRMSLLLNERLFSFTVRQLEKIRDALTA